MLTNYREFFGAYKIPEVSNDSENLHDDTKWLQAKTGLIQSNDMDMDMDILAVKFEVTVAGEERARVTRYDKPDPRRKTSLDQSAPRLS